SDKGWIVLYHGISKNHHTYRVGAILLDKKDPTKVLARTTAPIFEPELPYEKEGLVPNVVFPCGTVVRAGVVFIYYGAADKVIGLAKIKLTDLEKVFE
ncbi:MAG: glycosylase, partial [Parcubacteria group bacterium Gr01-1014_73]